MKTILTLLVCFSIGCYQLQAQTTFQPRKQSTKKGFVYDKEVSSDFRLQTNGWSVGMNWGNLVNYYTTRYYYVDFGERKHLRELMINPGIGQNSYTYGKQNNLFAVRGGIGEKRYFTEKAATKKGVAIGVSYRLGPTLGLLKPYQLEIGISESPVNNNVRTITYSEETAREFLNENQIIDNAGFFRGWNQVRPRIGGHAMGAMHISWGAFEDHVRAVDAGVMIDFFVGSVPILVETADTPANQNTPLFVNLFLNFQLGKRK
ncbi:MAG: hypothetical protein AAGI23_04565 [Bacteroidota bacterium]